VVVVDVVEVVLVVVLVLVVVDVDVLVLVDVDVLVDVEVRHQSSQVGGGSVVVPSQLSSAEAHDVTVTAPQSAQLDEGYGQRQGPMHASYKPSLQSHP